MSKKGLFRRILLLYSIVVVLAVLFLEAYIAGFVRENHIGNLRDGLSVQASLIAAVLPAGRAVSLDDECRRLKETTGARITIIAPDGKVLGDSDRPSASMDNHKERPEVQQAALSDTGYSTRLSGTLEEELLYVAKRASKDGKTTGFVRLAVPLRDIDLTVGRLRLKVMLAAAVILLATVAFSIAQKVRLRRLVGQITEFSEALASGELQRRLILDGAGELGAIAQNLNSMAAEFKSALARSEDENERLNAILKNVPDALLIIDSSGKVVLSSTASMGFFGAPKIIGRRASEVVRSPAFLDMLSNARCGLKPLGREVRLDQPDEKYASVEVSPLFNKRGEAPGFVAVFHDITGAKRFERVRKDFVANVSHEIKTPISAIKGFADTLIEGAIEDIDNALKFLEIIRSNSVRINSLVDDLMTISKIELGAVRMEKANTDLAEVLGHVASMLGDRARSKGLYIRVDVSPHVEKAMADGDRLIQIITNLADNAIKFTDRGGVALGTCVEDGAKVIFVSDTGAGIPEKHLPRLGERFYRVDSSRSRELGGTGLGLAIVKHLVKAHGWAMVVESSEGVGTKVKLVLGRQFS